MDNMKHIREKIESLITCGDRHCPTLSERYHRHLIKHHSLRSNQTPHTDTLSQRSNLSISSYSKEKSTVSLRRHSPENGSKVNNNTQKIIMDWSKDLPVYYNPKFEEIKQNVVNELIDNINTLMEHKNTTDDVLDIIKHEIAENIYCIPLTYQQQNLLQHNLLQRFKVIMIKKSRESEKKSRDNVCMYDIYPEENVNESPKKYSVQNSYVDIMKNISPILLTYFKLSSINIDSHLHKCNTNEIKQLMNNAQNFFRLRVCKSRTHKRIVQNKKKFENISNYFAVTEKCRDILKDTAYFYNHNKLSLSNITISRMADIKEIEINTITKNLQDSLGSSILIYRSEDENAVTNIFPITTGNNKSERAGCGVDAFKNELLNWLLEKESFLQHNVKTNKKDRNIAKISKTLYAHMSKKASDTLISKDVNKLLNKLLKPEFKNDTEILSKQLMDRLYSLFPETENSFKRIKTSEQTQAFICTNIDTNTLEYSLKNLLLKYVVALSEEESLLVQGIYRLLFKNKIQAMLNSKLCNKNHNIKEKENVLSCKLKNDIEYIEILTNWIKSVTSDKTILSLETSSEIIIDIMEILKNIKDNVTEITLKESNESNKRQILDKLSSILHFDCNNDAHKLVNKLIQIYSEGTICKECDDQNRSDVIDDYFYLHGQDTIKENLKFNVFLKRILREIEYHCFCHLHSIVIHSDFEYVKEICNWLNNLPLLSYDKYIQNEILNMVIDFMNEIKINIEDYDSCIKNFIVALPLNKNKEIDIQLATRQLKKRLQYVNKIDDENKRETGIKENQVPKMDIVVEIENLCHNLPITAFDNNTTVVLKKQLAWNLLKKVGELNINFEYYDGEDNEMLYENDVTLVIDGQLNDSPLSDTLDDNITVSLKNQLLNKFIQNFNAIENKNPLERYILHLRNLFELSLRSNANIKTEEDTVLLKKIRDALVFLSLLGQFKTTDDELTKKYVLFLMEEICAYLQYTKTIFIIPFLLDPNQDLMTNDIVKYQNHPLIAKILKFIKTRSVLGNWIELLPIQKPNGLQGTVKKYEMLTEMTDLVTDIENKFNYNDSYIDEALVKCIQVLPLSVSLQERLCVDLKNILISTLNERNNHIGNTAENYITAPNKINSNSQLISYNPAEQIAETKRGEGVQNSTKTLEPKTNHWYSLPPATTTNDNTTSNDSYIDGKVINEHNLQKSSLHESSTINYKDFEKGVDLKSSTSKLSPMIQTEPSILNYEDFEKGVDFNSSLIELSPLKQEAQIVDLNGAKSDNALAKEEIKSSCTGAQTSYQKSSSPMKIERELQTKMNRYVPGCKSQKSSQTLSLTTIHPKKETSHEKSDRIIMEQYSERAKTFEQDDQNYTDDIECKCHRKCLPCYIRRYCKICNRFPFRYPELHFW